MAAEDLDFTLEMHNRESGGSRGMTHPNLPIAEEKRVEEKIVNKNVKNDNYNKDVYIKNKNLNCEKEINCREGLFPSYQDLSNTM